MPRSSLSPGPQTRDHMPSMTSSHQSATQEARRFPFASAYDPSERAPSSVDPLGFTANSDRIANLMLPDIMNRMARARLITLTVVAADISRRAFTRLPEGAKADVTLADCRLAFERLVVTGLIAAVPPADTRRLPGQRLGRTARGARQPLTAENYLKAPEINAPSGVYATLARGAGLIEAQSFEPTSYGEALIAAWKRSEQAGGVFEGMSDLEIEKQLEAYAKRAAGLVVDPVGQWPSHGNQLWSELGRAFALDSLRVRGARDPETMMLRGVLAASVHLDASASQARERMLSLLRTAPSSTMLSLGDVQRDILWNKIRPRLGTEKVDQRIGAAIQLLEATEQPAAILEAMFYLLCETVRSNGSQTPELLLSRPEFSKPWLNMRSQLIPLRATIAKTLTDDAIAESIGADRATILRDAVELVDDLDRILTYAEDGVQPLLSRHARVQRAKNRGVWISNETGAIALHRGNNDYADRARPATGYPHPLRLASMLSLMADLKLVSQAFVMGGGVE